MRESSVLSGEGAAQSTKKEASQDREREMVLPGKIELESVVSSLLPRLPVLVAWVDCQLAEGLGDHVLAIDAIFAIINAMQEPLPVVLLSGKDFGIVRFKTLCQYRAPGSGQYKIYDLSVQLSEIAQFDSTNYIIKGFLGIGCRYLSEEYVQLMSRDGGRAVFPCGPTHDHRLAEKHESVAEGSAAVSEATSESVPSETPDIFTKLNYFSVQPLTRALVMGFGLDRAGVAYTPYPEIARRMSAEDLMTTQLPERLIAGYGLVCISRGRSRLTRPYVLDYLTDFFNMPETGRSNMVVALGYEKVITEAVTDFANNSIKSVVLIDWLNRKKTTYSSGRYSSSRCASRCPAGAESFDESELSQSDPYYILMSRNIPHARLRQLIEYACPFVGLTSATLAILGLGAGKLVHYQASLKGDDTFFLYNYLSSIKSAIDQDKSLNLNEIQKKNLQILVQLLFHQDELVCANKSLCARFLTNPQFRHYLSHLSQLNRELVEQNARRFPVNVLTALQLPADPRYTARFFPPASDSRETALPPPSLGTCTN